MAVFFGVLLAMCCVKASVGFGCEGKDVNKIVDMLTEIYTDWEVLADVLNAKRGTIDAIQTTCTDAGGSIWCYRREVVKWYCDSTGYEPEVICENIAQALERIGRDRPAANLRALEFNDASISQSGGQPAETAAVDGDTCSSDDPECKVPNPLSFTATLPAEKWREEVPGEEELFLIGYKDVDGKIKHYRFIQNLQMTWKDVGRRLGIGQLQLDIYHVQHLERLEEQALEVFSHWKNVGSQKYPFTWNGVLEVLRAAELEQVAHKLEKVLRNKVELPGPVEAVSEHPQKMAGYLMFIVYFLATVCAIYFAANRIKLFPRKWLSKYGTSTPLVNPPDQSDDMPVKDCCNSITDKTEND